MAKKDENSDKEDSSNSNVTFSYNQVTIIEGESSGSMIKVTEPLSLS